MSGELCDAGVRNKHGHPDITRKDKKKIFFDRVCLDNYRNVT